MRVVYIHGATASNRSFAYIQKSIRAKDPVYLSYEKDSSAKDNLARMKEELAQIDEPLFFITHSLGGIYAVYLQAEFANSAKAVSLATPFAGSEIAIWSNLLMPHYQLFNDITPNSDFIRSSRKIPITIPWTQFVTTVGDVPWLRGANDGIVTRESMVCRDDTDLIEIDRNHYEIVQSKRVVKFILNVMQSTTA
jgi:pimeloyl-ACP methyl ester carboxylesterase